MFNAGMRDGTIGVASRSGVIAGLSYAVAETTFSNVLPGFVQRSDLYQPVHFGVTALLFLVYPLLGLIGALLLTGILQFCVRREPEKLHAAASASGTLFFLCLVVWSLALPHFDSRLHMFAAALATVSAVCIGAEIATLNSGSRLRPLTLGWTAVSMPLAIAVFPPVVGSTSWQRLGIAIAMFAAFYGAGSIRRIREAKSLTVAATLVAASVIVLATAWPVFQGAYVRVSPSPVSSKERPNVLLVVMDTVRADHTSLYGYQRDTTPNLELLEKDPQSTVFLRATSAADWTLPSHASMFTGLYPSQHGSSCENGNRSVHGLSEGAVTLAERLRDDGYATAGVVANVAALLRTFTIDQGFEYYATRLPPTPIYGGAFGGTLRRSILRTVRSIWVEPNPPRLYPDGGAITRELKTVLSGLHTNPRPWFVFANYMDAHTPYNPPSPYETRYSSAPGMRIEAFYSYGREVMSLKRPFSRAEIDPMMARYDAGIAFVDAQIGEIVNELRRLGAYDETMIIITSDHGEAFGEHTMMDHGVSVYEDQVHVPLLIKWPRGIRPPDGNRPASGVDLMPTILDVIGAKAEPGIAGRSLRSPSEAVAQARFAESIPCLAIYDLHPRFRRNASALFRGEWKLIASTNGKMELYNVEADPAEQHNVFDIETEVASRLSLEYQVWKKYRQRLGGGSAATLSDEERERLKSLGYVQ